MDTAMKWTIGLGAGALGVGVLAALMTKSTPAAAAAAPVAAPPPYTPPSTPVPVATLPITDPSLVQIARNAMIAIAPTVGATYTSATQTNDPQLATALATFQGYVNAHMTPAQLALYGIPGPLRTDGVLDEATYMALIANAAAIVAAAGTPAAPPPVFHINPTPGPVTPLQINPNVFAPTP